MKIVAIITALFSVASHGQIQHYTFNQSTSAGSSQMVNLALSKRSVELIKKDKSSIRMYDLSFLRHNKSLLFVDYAAGSLNELTRKHFDSLLSNGFTEVPSEFKSEGIFVEGSIGYKTSDFVIETALEQGIVLKKSKLIYFASSPHVSIKLKFIDSHASLYKNRGIGFLGSYFGDCLFVSDKSPSSLGYDFLKGFDWILDFARKHVYARKNSVRIGSSQTAHN